MDKAGDEMGEELITAISAAAKAITEADHILVGAGAGLSTSAGYTYSGPRFTENFGDFIHKYGFTDLYSAGFYRFPSPEEHWAFWSRQIDLNRYQPIPKPVYEDLFSIVRGRDYFVLTTNVDHCFQRSGFDKNRLFYTQGDFGLWQCSLPCHNRTYDNEATVKQMVASQKDMAVPADLVPFCPRCGRPMTMNLRIDNTFVEDNGWHEAARRYRDFAAKKGRTVYLELGVGENTPIIIKYPFQEMTRSNPQATYITVNLEKAWIPDKIRNQTVELTGDIGGILRELKTTLQIA